MGAKRTYQKRFERQAGLRLERSLAPLRSAELPEDFLDLLRKADGRRAETKEQDKQSNRADDTPRRRQNW